MENSIQFEEMAYEFGKILELVNLKMTKHEIDLVQQKCKDMFKKRNIDIQIGFFWNTETHNFVITGVRDSDNMFLLAFTYWQEFRLLEKKTGTPHKRLQR